MEGGGWWSHREEWEGFDWTLLALKIEKGGMIQGILAAFNSWKRQRNEFSSGASRKWVSPANTLILVQWDLFQTSDLQDYKISCCWASLVVHGLRICPAMQGTPVPSLLPEDSLCCRATKPVKHNFWNLQALEPQQEKPLHSEACTPQLRKTVCSNEDQHSPKIKKEINYCCFRPLSLGNMDTLEKEYTFNQ